MDTTPFITQNWLLAALPRDVMERWAPYLEPVALPLGKVLYESGETLKHVYFPTTAIVSLLYVMKDGDSAEIAVIGNDGLVGISLFMGGGSTIGRALVQNTGSGMRMDADFMKQEFDGSMPVLHLFLRFTQALFTQMTQTAACNKHHSLDQQLCRWLLLSLDRHEGIDLVMTERLISNMLGIPVATMEVSALVLQAAGLIAYEHGTIRVLDRLGLEHRSCECYAVVKDEYDRLLPRRH